MIACAEAGTGVGSGTCSDSDIGRALGAADASTGAGSRSLVVSWGGSDCGVAVFSFSVGKSLSVSNLTSATIGSGALTAGVWGGAGCFTDRFGLRPHGGTQGQTGGKCRSDDDTLFHVGASFSDTKRALSLPVRQETKCSFS